MAQIPIGPEQELNGLIDLVRMRALYFDGEHGQDLREEDIPADMQDEAEAARDELVATVSGTLHRTSPHLDCCPAISQSELGW